MKTTTEQLQNIYKQAMQYCVVKYGGEPDELHLLEDGSFKVVYHKYCRGEYTEEEYFDASCLTQDLIQVYEERKKREEEERIKAEKERIKRQREYDAQQKEKRKQEYLKLKEEFEK